MVMRAYARMCRYVSFLTGIQVVSAFVSLYYPLIPHLNEFSRLLVK